MQTKVAFTRWHNSLNPKTHKTNWSLDDSKTLLSLHKQLGSKWRKICVKFPGRTDNYLKNQFFSLLRRTLRRICRYLSVPKSEFDQATSQCAISSPKCWPSSFTWTRSAQEASHSENDLFQWIFFFRFSVLKSKLNLKQKVEFRLKIQINSFRVKEKSVHTIESPHFECFKQCLDELIKMNALYVQFRRKKKCKKDKFSNFKEFLASIGQESEKRMDDFSEQTEKEKNKSKTAEIENEKDSETIKNLLAKEMIESNKMNSNSTKHEKCASHLTIYENLISKLILGLECGKGKYIFKSSKKIVCKIYGF